MNINIGKNEYVILEDKEQGKKVLIGTAFSLRKFFPQEANFRFDLDDDGTNTPICSKININVPGIDEVFCLNVITSGSWSSKWSVKIQKNE